jgi:hypothetical protein
VDLDKDEVMGKHYILLWVSYFNIIEELVRKDMDVNEHEKLSNITIRHI